MKTSICAIGALLLTTAPVFAGGIARSDQSVGILFEEGKNYVELSYGRVRPEVSGSFVGRNPLTGAPVRVNISDVAGNHYLPGIRYKTEINDKVSVAFIYDHFYGADIAYEGDPARTVLGGTRAKVNSQGFTFLARYKFDDNWSVHGGIRASKADASVTLSGLGYGPVFNGTNRTLNGYSANLESDWGVGYAIGAAYERPEIAMRVALTYQSKITHNFPTTERLGAFAVSTGTETEVVTPESVTLDFQSGVAPDTLVFGSVRWEHWTQMVTKPVFFDRATGGENLTDLSNSTTYTLGVGRKFNENWSGSVFANYEKVGGGDEVSPLAPTNGYKGIGLAAVYSKDNMKITTAVRYLKLGDAKPTTSQPVAQMDDNYVVAAGIKVGFSF
ncbi:OmpP1/FadL family transporter [Paracoccus jiaweipingae]|uniref:OmpP1/FadL family transporter n=1 Tax=unclassified Paracoccus (in: a-proteobacteria) TaxID=2688777 RepID=UPI0037AEA916